MTSIIILSLAVLLRILANPAANVFQKQLTVNGIHPVVVNCITYCMLAVLCMVPAMDINWLQWSSSFWWYTAGVGLCGAVGNGFLIRALKGGELSVLGPVNSYKSIVSLLFGIILLGEMPGISGLVGIMLIIYGSYFVLETTDEKFTPALFRRKDIRYRILAMVLTAIEAVLLKKVILLSTVMVSFIVWCWAGAVFSTLMVLLESRRSNPVSISIKIRQAGKYALLVACIGTMQYCTNFVFGRMPVAYALALFQLSMIVTVFFGYHFFNEQQIGNKILGTLIMIAGSVLIILV